MKSIRVTIDCPRYEWYEISHVIDWSVRDAIIGIIDDRTVEMVGNAVFDYLADSKQLWIPLSTS